MKRNIGRQSLGKGKSGWRKRTKIYKKEKGIMEPWRYCGKKKRGGGGGETRLWSYLNVVPDSKEMEHYLVSISVLYMITWNTQ